MGIIGLYMAVLFISPQIISLATTGLIAINKIKLSTNDFIDFSKAYISFGFINFSISFFLSISSILFFKVYWQIFFILPILSFLIFISAFHQAELVQDGKSKVYGSYTLINSITTALFTILFINYLNLDWDGRLWAMLVGQSSVVLVMYKKTFTTLLLFKINVDKEKFKEFIYFGLPIFVGLGAGWALNQADNYIVLHFFTLKEVGIYSVAYSIGNIVNIINQATTNAIIPKLYTAFENKKGHQIVKKTNLYYSIIIIGISLFIGLNAYWYMPIIFGERYAQSANIVFFISLAFAFNGIYRTSGAVVAFHKQNKLRMKLLYLSAITNITISIALIPYFGLLSPAIGTLIAYILLAYTNYFYGWKILRQKELT